MGLLALNPSLSWFLGISILIFLASTLGDSVDTYGYFNESLIPYKRSARRHSRFIIPEDSDDRLCEKSSTSKSEIRCYIVRPKGSWQQANATCLALGAKLLCAQTKIDDRDNTAALMREAKRLIQKRYNADFRRIWALDQNCQIPEGYTRYSGDRCQCLWFQDIYAPIPNFMFEVYDCDSELPFICETTVNDIVNTTTSTTVTSLTTSVLHSSTSKPRTFEPPDSFFCENQTVAGVAWPQVPWGAKVVLPCPEPFKGSISWFCDLETKGWYPDVPDMSDCSSASLHDLLQDVKNYSNVEDVVDKLVNVTSGGASVGGDVIVALEILDKIDDIFQKQKENETEDARQKAALSLATGAITAGSNLLVDTDIWQEIPKDSRRNTGTRFLNVIENYGFILTQNINTTEHTIQSSNIGMQVLKKPRSKNHTSALTLPLESTFTANHTAQLILPQNFETFLPPGNETLIVFIKYSQLDKIFLVDEHGSGFNVTDDTRVNSPVLSTSLMQRSLPVHISSNIEIILEHLVPGAERPVCTFWNENEGAWNASGCIVDRLKSNETHTVCLCDHLTNFAVLMDITGHIDPKKTFALVYVTIVGCAISIFCLILCIFIFTFFKSLWSITTSIHRNLCICLLLGELLLLFGLDRTENKMVCSVIAGGLHYAFLAAFTWMFLEGVQLYFMLIRVFIPKRNYVLRYYAIGYGVPLVIVGITAAVVPDAYGTDRYCWLSPEDGAIWSFVGPVLTVIMMNLVALVMALWSSTRVSSAKHDTLAVATKKLAKGAVALVFILGLTWGIGLLLPVDHIIVAYAFAVLNSLQGVGIFIFYCLIHDKTRNVVFGWVSKSVTSGLYLSFRTNLSSKRFSNTTTTSRLSSEVTHRFHISKPPPAPLVVPMEGTITLPGDNVVL